MAARIALNSEWSRTWWQRSAFCAYLLIVGGLSAALWVLARCGTVSPLRYDLLAILGAVGLTAWFLSVERRPAVRGLAIAVVLAWAGISALAHGRVWDEYFPHPRVSPKFRILAGLEAAGVRYAKADYWNAYYLTFLSGERVIVGSDGLVRIAEYNREAVHSPGRGGPHFQVPLRRPSSCGARRVLLPLLIYLSFSGINDLRRRYLDGSCGVSKELVATEIPAAAARNSRESLMLTTGIHNPHLQFPNVIT